MGLGKETGMNSAMPLQPWLCLQQVLLTGGQGRWPSRRLFGRFGSCEAGPGAFQGRIASEPGNGVENVYGLLSGGPDLVHGLQGKEVDGCEHAHLAHASRVAPRLRDLPLRHGEFFQDGRRKFFCRPSSRHGALAILSGFGMAA